MNRENAILLLGPHRCGTSCIAQLVGMNGFQFGHDVLGEHVCNATGLWENAAVVAFNEGLLGQMRAAWFVPSRAATLLEGQPMDGHVDALEKLLRSQFEPGADIVIKDPRISRFASLYSDVLERMGYRVRFLLVLRSPAASAESLYRRDGIPRSVGQALWIDHMISSLTVLRQGSDALLVSYDALVARPGPVVEHLAKWLHDTTHCSPRQLAEMTACVHPELCSPGPSSDELRDADAASKLSGEMFRYLSSDESRVPETETVRSWERQYRELMKPGSWSRSPSRIVVFEAPEEVSGVLAAALPRLESSRSSSLLVMRDGEASDYVRDAIEASAAVGRLGLFYNRSRRGEGFSLLRGLSLAAAEGIMLVRRAAVEHFSYWLDWLESSQGAAGVVAWSKDAHFASMTSTQAVFVPAGVAKQIDPWTYVDKQRDALDCMLKDLSDARISVERRPSP